MVKDNLDINKSIIYYRKNTVILSIIWISLLLVLILLWWYFLIRNDNPEYLSVAVMVIVPALGIIPLAVIYTFIRFLHLKKTHRTE